MYNLKEVQRALKAKGFNPGPIDGLEGPKTDAAIVAFKRSIGYRARPYLGPLTLAALLNERVDPAKNKATGKVPSKRPPWLKVAYTYIGLREIKGSRHNPKIVEWWKKLGLHFRDDETPWCAGFVNGVIEEAGFRSPPKYDAAARGWDWTGHGAKLSGPCVGAIVTFWRGKKSSGTGHIGFVVGKDQKGNLMVLGGNQGNAVNIKPFSLSRVLSYRWPDGSPMPTKTGMDTLPVVMSNGKLSTNEA